MTYREIIVVVSASGSVGREAVSQLDTAAFAVRSLTRDPGVRGDLARSASGARRPPSAVADQILPALLEPVRPPGLHPGAGR